LRPGKRLLGRRLPCLGDGSLDESTWPGELVDATGPDAGECAGEGVPEMLDVRLVSVFVEMGTSEGRLVELESRIRPQNGLC